MLPATWHSLKAEPNPKERKLPRQSGKIKKPTGEERSRGATFFVPRGLSKLAARTEGSPKEQINQKLVPLQ